MLEASENSTLVLPMMTAKFPPFGAMRTVSNVAIDSTSDAYSSSTSNGALVKKSRSSLVRCCNLRAIAVPPAR